jgi:hypothetical protein
MTSENGRAFLFLFLFYPLLFFFWTRHEGLIWAFALIGKGRTNHKHGQPSGANSHFKRLKYRLQTSDSTSAASLIK